MRTLYTGLTPPDADCVHTPLIEIVPVADDTAARRNREKAEKLRFSFINTNGNPRKRRNALS